MGKEQLKENGVGEKRGGRQGKHKEGQKEGREGGREKGKEPTREPEAEHFLPQLTQSWCGGLNKNGPHQLIGSDII